MWQLSVLLGRYKNAMHRDAKVLCSNMQLSINLCAYSFIIFVGFCLKEGRRSEFQNLNISRELISIFRSQEMRTHLNIIFLKN